jgi:hypothetical protein
MCMIAHRFLSEKGKGANIPNAVIDTAMYRHPDGYGVAWRSEEGLLYQKFGPDGRQGFRELVKALDGDQSVEYVAHFRFATHGPEDANHAHPFAYEDPDPSVGTVLVFHNGVISSMKTTLAESDTEVFVRDYLAKLPSRWWTNEAVRKLVDHIGGWSRLVLMTNEETVNLNWGEGEEDGGLWYSSDHRPNKWVTGTTVASTVYSSSKDYRNWDYDDDEEWVKVEDGWRRNPNSKFAKSPSTAEAAAATFMETTIPKSNGDMFMHEGHELSPMQTFDFTKDGDYEVSVLCETCGTAGDVYIVDGRAYVDVPHKWDIKEDGVIPLPDKAATIMEAEGGFCDAGDTDLLPDEMEDLLPEPVTAHGGTLIPMNYAAAELIRAANDEKEALLN